MARLVEIWTWDVGRRPVDMDGEECLLLPILETVLEGGLWWEFRKFPIDTVARLRPRLNIHPQLRRLVDVWVEEAPVPAR